LLDSLGFVWAYRNTSYVISSKNLWQILHPLGHSGQKRIPRNVLNMPRQALERLWESLVLGDGWIDKGSECHKYATASLGLVDDIQELLQKLGKPCGSIYTRDAGYGGGIIRGRSVTGTMPLYMIGERRGRKATITTKDKQMLLEKTPYSGMVYCVTVPNGTLVVRRNKKPMVCGNCIDVLRYAAIAGIDHVDETRNLATRQGAGGY
jgi:replicative DNA helicase Mcm